MKFNCTIIEVKHNVYGKNETFTVSRQLFETEVKRNYLYLQ